MSGFLQPSGQVQVSSQDETEGPLNTELVPGSGIVLTTLNPGGDEKLQISSVGGAPGGSAGGDLSGTYPDPTVAKIQTKTISSKTPTDGYALVWNSSANMWSPQTQDGYRLQNRAVDSTAPTDGYALVWSVSQNKWISSSTIGGLTLGPAKNPENTVDQGIVNTDTTKTLSLAGVRSSGANNVSVDVIADVNNPTIDASHKVLRMGWENNQRVFTEFMNVKESEWELQSSTSAKVLSSEADGGSVTAVTLGSENSFITPGAKLLSIVNGAPDGYERMSVDYTGDVKLNIKNNAQYLGFKCLTEVYTVPAAADGYSSIQIPASALAFGISVRVITSVPTAATFSVGISGVKTRYGTSISTVAGTTSVGTSAGIIYYGTATSLLITPNATPGSATGQLRLSIHYIEIVPPTG